MNPGRNSVKNPTSRLATPGVGGVRPGSGVHPDLGPGPVPRSQGTQRGEASLGCDSKSGRAAGPSSFLDSIENNRNTFCGSWTVVGDINQNGKSFIHIARLGCKRWRCYRCGPKRARQLRKAIIDKAEELKLQRFLTLTLDPSQCSVEQSVEYIRETWNKLRTYLRRRYNQPITFISIIELQKSGYAHLHVLVDRYIPQKWIKSAWQRVGGGKFVNIKFVDVHRVAAYLSKYLTKDLFLNQFKPGTRRFTTSRGINLFIKPKKGTWQLIKNSIENIKPAINTIIFEKFINSDGILQWYRIEIENN